MQAYRDPAGAFTIEYPKTWKVQRGDNGYTVFYRDDPEEGTLFGAFPRLVLNGQATAAQILEMLKRDVRQRYPDFEVKSQKIEPTAAGELAIVYARWTNSRNERMVTSLTFHVGVNADRRSELTLINIQAPEVAFEALEPTFQHMFNTFLHSSGRQGRARGPARTSPAWRLVTEDYSWTAAGSGAVASFFAIQSRVQ
jgi:hypothetical protein